MKTLIFTIEGGDTPIYFTFLLRFLERQKYMELIAMRPKVRGLSLSNFQITASAFLSANNGTLSHLAISFTHSPHLSVSFVYFLSSSLNRLPPEITCRGIDKLSDHENSQTLSLSLSLSLCISCCVNWLSACL